MGFRTFPTAYSSDFTKPKLPSQIVVFPLLKKLSELGFARLMDL